MNLKVILPVLCVTGGLTDPILAQPPRTKQPQQSRQPQPGKQPQQYPRLRNYQRAPLFEWTIPVYPFTEEANYMSIFGYVRHRYFLSPNAPPPTPTRDASSVAGTSWSRYAGMQEQQRFIFRTDGQVEICPGDGSNRDPGDIRNPKPMRGTYYWQQRGEAIYIHGILPAQHYPKNVALGPDIKIEYIGVIADKPLRIGVHEGIHLRGVVRNLYGPSTPWFALKRPQPSGPGQ